MRKSWVSLGVGLILVGIGGAALCGFQFGKEPVAYSRTWTFGTDQLRGLSIEGDGHSFDIRFVPSDDGTNSVEMNGKIEPKLADRILRTDIEDGVLELNLEHDNRFFRLDIGDLGGIARKQTVTVKLTPEAESALKLMRLRSDAGSLHVSGAKTQEADIATDAGTIRVDGFEGERLKLSCDLGKIEAADIRADLEARTDFGNIDIRKATGSLEAATDAGTINVDHLRGEAKLSADTGSVKLQKDDTSSADIKADAGSVQVELPASFAGSYDLKSASGSVEAPEAQGTAADVVRVRTDTGNIRVSLLGR